MIRLPSGTNMGIRRKNPVLGIVMREFNSAIASAELNIVAIKANARRVRSFAMVKTDPVLQLRRSSYLEEKQLGEYLEIYIRVKRDEFRFNKQGLISLTSGIHFLEKIKAVKQTSLRKSGK